MPTIQSGSQVSLTGSFQKNGENLNFSSILLKFNQSFVLFEQILQTDLACNLWRIAQRMETG